MKVNKYTIIVFILMYSAFPNLCKATVNDSKAWQINGASAALSNSDRDIFLKALGKLNEINGFNELTTEQLEFIEKKAELVNSDSYFDYTLALKILKKCDFLRHKNKTGILKRLSDEDWLIRESALELAKKITPLSVEFLSKVIDNLKHNNLRVRQAVVNVIKKQGQLNRINVKEILALLNKMPLNYFQLAIGA